jgi:hypothetical protein
MAGAYPVSRLKLFFAIHKNEREKIMKKITGVIILGIFLLTQAPLFAAEGPVEKLAVREIDKVETSCTVDLETFCQDVTPGEGRGVACLYAHSDKISTPCLTALYEAKGEFRNAMDNVNAFVADCRTDILAQCSKVAIGEGRILACLEKNKKNISPKCRENLKGAHGDLTKADQIV